MSAGGDPEVFYQDQPTPYWNDPDSSMTSDGVGWWREEDGERVGPFDTEAEAREDDAEAEHQAEWEEAQDNAAQPAWCQWCHAAPCRCRAEDAAADRLMDPED